MPRPYKPRHLNFRPQVYYFKPQGIPLRLLEEITLQPDELEAIKLHDLDNLDQTQAAKIMQISQSTFARILNRAYHKLALALTQGKAIKLTPIKH